MRKFILGLFAVLVVIHIASINSESYIRDRALQLRSEHELCSAEQVRAPSGVDYILTAGHCRDIANNGYMTVIDSHGNKVQRRVIAEDKKSDLLLLEGMPGLKGLSIANSIKDTQHVRTFTSGGARPTHESEGELMGKEHIDIPLDVITNDDDKAKCEAFGPKNQVLQADTLFGPVNYCALSVDEVSTTAKIIPGSSGGMIVNDSGDLVGVASATDENFGFIVQLSDIHAFLAGY